MRTGRGTTLGYHDHYVVDGGKRRIILAALVTPADVMENVPLRDLLWRVCFRRKLRPRPGDRRHHLRHDREHRCRRGRRHPGVLPPARFRSHGRRSSAGARSPTMPSGTPTAAPAARSCASARPSTPSRSVVYRRRAAACNTCPSRPSAPRVTRAGKCSGPSMRTTWSGCAATTPLRPTGRRCANGRSGSSRCLPKPRSGTAYAGCDYAACMNANIQGLLIAAGQNLKRFLAATGWGRRMPRVGASWPFQGSQTGSQPSTGGDRSAPRAGHRPTGMEWSGAATPATGGFFQRPDPFPAPPPHDTDRVIGSDDIGSVLPEMRVPR